MVPIRVGSDVLHTSQRVRERESGMRSGGEFTKRGYLCCVVIQCERDQVGQCQPRQRIQRASTRERKRQGHSACVPLVRVLASGRARCRMWAAAGRRRRVVGRRRRVGGGCSFFVALQSIPSAVSSQHPSPVTSHRPAPTTHYHPPPPITHSPPHSIGRNKICTFWQTTPPPVCSVESPADRFGGTCLLQGGHDA